jgi:hypothetical protein
MVEAAAITVGDTLEERLMHGIARDRIFDNFDREVDEGSPARRLQMLDDEVARAPQVGHRPVVTDL